jgi:hypothetical protein
MRIIKVKISTLIIRKIILLIIFFIYLNFKSFSQNTFVFDTLGISLNIKPYDTISSSQIIILNNNNNINWGVFEGEGGVLKLYDENENFLSRHFLIPMEEWHLKDSIRLYTTLKFKTFSKKGKITFINNPGGGSEEEAGKQIKFDISVLFK